MTDKISWILQYLSVRPGLRLNFSEICRSNRWQQTALLKEFKSEFGLTPKQFETFLRLKTAFLLLKQHSVKCIAIAEELGFKNDIRFSEWFKSQTGETPSFYRSLTSRQQLEFEVRRLQMVLNVSTRPKEASAEVKNGKTVTQTA